MEAIFRLVLTTSLYASVAGIIIVILKAILKDRINPQWHYIIWIVLLLKLLVPFGPESALSLFNRVPDISQQANFNQIYQEYHQSYDTIQQSGDKSNIPTIWVVQDSSLHFAAMAENAIPYIWFSGAMLMFGWLIFTNLSINRRIQKASIPVPQEINSIFSECRKKTGIDKDIRLVCQNVINTPSIFGVLKPRILINPEIADMSSEDVSYVILHELAHYKRKDLIANYLLLLLQLVHWFNPFIWYCFKRIRQDMEVAADELVLNLLEPREQKDYGRALLAVLENFSAPKLAPRMIGMVDDKKSIERRLKMIKMMGFFKNRRRNIIIIGILCVAILGGVLLTSGLTKGESAKEPESQNDKVQTLEYNAAEIIKYKSAYIGDSSNDSHLVRTLPFAAICKGISLKTDSKPYGITVNYDFNGLSLTDEAINATLRNNALVLFALIDNVDKVSFSYHPGSDVKGPEYTREQLQKSYTKDLGKFAENEASLQQLLNSFQQSFITSPEKYALYMSSTPGLRILAHYGGKADKIEYTVTSGTFESWGIADGKITDLGKTASVPPGNPVYWSPLDGQSVSDKKEIAVKASIYSKDSLLSEKQLFIEYDPSSLLYTVAASGDVVVSKNGDFKAQNPKTVDEAVSQAILSRGKGYKEEEVFTEGHTILDTEEKNNRVKVYTISSFGSFGFENGIFTKVSGSGAIPTVITFIKNENGEYSLLEYKEPQDGSYYIKSIKEMFPSKMWSKVLNGQKYYPDLAKQQEEQAKKYLESIGRDSKVSEAHVEKKLPSMNVDAQNKLFGELTKYDQELNSFPYWLGTRELLQNGTRYVYKTEQGKTADGYDLITFTKLKEDGTVVKVLKYKIVGSDPQLID